MHKPANKLRFIGSLTMLVGLVVAFSTAKAAPRAAPLSEGSASVSLDLEPGQLQPGERANGLLRLEDAWPELPERARLILVADASGSMAGSHNTALKEALSAMIEDFNLEQSDGPGAQPDPPYPTWTRVPVTGSLSSQPIFTVAVPPGWTVSPLQGIDSDVGVIAGDGVRLEFDYGMWSNPLPDPGEPGYEVTFESIGCRSAKLVQPRSGPADLTGAYWHDTGQSIWTTSGPDKLQISGRGMSADAHEIALSILRSVRFNQDCGGAGTQVAVVAFNSSAQLLCGLMSETAELLQCVQAIGAAGGTHISVGMESAYDELVRQGQPPADVAEVMVVFTDGADSRGCQAVLAIADLAKERGVLIITVSMGDQTDQACMVSAATSPRHHYHVPDSTGLRSLFSSVRERIQSTEAVEGIALDLQLPTSLMLVPGSASLPPLESDTQHARWELPSAADQGIEISFEVEAQSTGRLGAGIAATYLLKSGDAPTYSAASQSVTVGTATECQCPPADQAFLPTGMELASAPAAFSGSVGCTLSPLTAMNVSWANYEQCGPAGAASVQLSGTGTVVVYQPSFEPAFPCRFALAASGAGTPFNVSLASGPFTVAIFSADSNGAQRRLQFGLDCSGGVPTPTTTPVRPTIYLPVAGQEACLIRRAHDLMLVVDTSDSMRERLSGGGTKLDAAQTGVDALLAALSAYGDQAGLVTFDDQARLLQPLTRALPSVGAALRGVQTASGTSIEAGLAIARRELTGPRRIASSRAVIVLLTDGRSHPAPASAAIAEAAAARSAGIQIWSIGIGPEVDARTLRTIAGLDSRFRAALRADELSAAFLAVARGVSCPGDLR